MDRTSNKKWVVVCIILIISGLVFQVINAITVGAQTEDAMLYWLAKIVNALTLILALVYLIKGYKKEDAKLYKAFLIVYGIGILISSASMVVLVNFIPVITRVLVPNYAIMYGTVMVLACAENLGEKKSMMFAWVNFALVAILLVALLITLPGTARGGTLINSAVDIHIAKYFILSLVLVVTTRSKYVDKETRGTK